jgi:DNA polymerase III subunit delta
MAEIKPAYLVTGSDEAKIHATRMRLRARAESEGGAAALEVFEPLEGRRGPDAEAVLAAIPALSLGDGRRYLLVDGVERWHEREAGAVAEALSSLPPGLTLVLIAHGKAPGRLSAAVKKAGGEVLVYEAPRERELPKRMAADAADLGFSLKPEAARLLVDRIGTSPLRLRNELERLALWAGDGGEVTVADLEAMVSDASDTAVWSLSDALLERDPERALAIAERLIGQGENVTGLIYGVASRLRKAHFALARLEHGSAPKQVESELGMHPYAAKQLIARVRHSSLEQLQQATAAIADLEVWCRGGAEYGEALALTLALRRAAGVPA